MTQILDGRALAKNLYFDFSRELEDFQDEYGVVPGLAVILVGDHPASLVYVKSKQRRCTEWGIRSHVHHLPKETSLSELQHLIDNLNIDPTIHGILLQLPLPPHLDTQTLLSQISPLKDVDGLHPENLGALVIGRPKLLPCTPQGCLQLIHSVRPNIGGANALVIGRSSLVGKPVSLLLTHHNATVTLAHSFTHGLPDLCRAADILVVAIGQPAFVQGDWVRPGSIVIDVGVNRVGETSLVGDVDFPSASKHAGAITPVPGGVGPLTIANLLKNTLKAAELQVC